MPNVIQKLGKKLQTKNGHHFHGFIWDVFSVGIFIVVCFLIVIPLMNIGNYATAQTIANCLNCTAAQKASIQGTGNGFFNSTPDVVLITLYFMLIISTFIAAGYEGANPALTLMLGLLFVILSEVAAFGISDMAHNYINQASNLNAKQHLPLSTYLVENLPIFNGFLTIAYIVFVISKKEVVLEGLAGGSAGGGGTVVTT